LPAQRKTKRELDANRAASGSIDESANPSLSDETLLERIAQRQDRSAFIALFNRFSNRIKSYLVRAGAPHDLAEEATQEAMITIWRRAVQFDRAKGSAAAWIFVIARNKRVDLFRRDIRAEAYSQGQTQNQAQDQAPNRAIEGDGESVYAAQERATKIRAALGDLSNEQKEVVILSFFEGRPHAEIAACLKIPIGTVKSRIRLAFSKLKVALDPHKHDV
jgi:RNA polymerase sigma-70 factor (ECF subfamily)